MNQAICNVPVSPMRAAPSHRSEMVSQLLFGELVTILESNGDFTLVQSVADKYEGWCQQSHVTYVTNVPEQTMPIYAGDWINPVMVDDVFMWIPFGSRVDLLSLEPLNSQFFFRGNQLKPGNPDITLLRDHAMKFMHSTYLWGGRSVFGVDCSGLCQQVFKLCGIALPRDAWQQALEGAEVVSLGKARGGDLAFFDNPEGRITHVGILLNNQSILHSSGNVRIDPIDSTGIIHEETLKRTHTLKTIRRYF